MSKTTLLLTLPFGGALIVTMALGLKKTQAQSDLSGPSAYPSPTVASATSSYGKAPHPLAGVASIIEADIVDAQYTFDTSIGPRTSVTLDNIVVHAGNAPREKVFSQLGGPLPNGHYVRVSDLPVLHPGSRYILFFGASDSFYTPVWADLAFRVEAIGGRRIVLGPQGHPVTSFNSKGVSFGATQIVDPMTERDPLKPLARVTSFSASLPDIAAALDASSFGQAAKEAAKAVGAPLGTPSLRAAPRVQWNVEATLALPAL